MLVSASLYWSVLWLLYGNALRAGGGVWVRVMTIFDECRRNRGSDPPQFTPAETTPTDARPGTAEKLEAMRLRALAGESLWHEDDLDLRTMEGGE